MVTSCPGPKDWTSLPPETAEGLVILEPEQLIGAVVMECQAQVTGAETRFLPVFMALETPGISLADGRYTRGLATRHRRLTARENIQRATFLIGEPGPPPSSNSEGQKANPGGRGLGRCCRKFLWSLLGRELTQRGSGTTCIVQLRVTKGGI